MLMKFGTAHDVSCIANVGDGQGGALPRATGVRLKLETNASLDSLASLAAAASSGGEDSTQLGPSDIVTGTVTSLLPLLVPTKKS